MLQKKVTKLIGLKIEDFNEFRNSKQIQLQPARLIPTLKTGDEMALTSTFLSTVKLVKEYRDDLFKAIKLSRGGKAYYFTEACFPDLGTSKIDGLIIVVVKNVIRDAAFFEMKNKSNQLDKEQICTYLDISKKLGVPKMVTVSNEFVANPTVSPVDVRPPKSVDLFHFSWSHLMTQGQLLLFKNENNIEDEDQVNIMKEALHYFKNPVSGVSGYTQMKPGWKNVAEDIRSQVPLKVSDPKVEEAILSWYEEENDMSLLLSRELGVSVKSTSRNKDGLKKDIKKFVKDYAIVGEISVKNAVSNIRIEIDFERRTVALSIRITPPLDKGNLARITWASNQLKNCSKKSEKLFKEIYDDLSLEAKLKFHRLGHRVLVKDIDELRGSTKDKEIQEFELVFVKSFGASFTSSKKFIVLIEQMMRNYYECIVQNATTWSRPTPKLMNDELKEH